MKHYILVVVALVLTAAGHLVILNAQDRAAQTKPSLEILEIPEYIGNYRQLGEDSHVSQHTLRVLQTSTILIRNYISPQGWPVQLTIVYAGATRRSLHFPEVCLVGAGWEVRKQESVPLSFLFNAKKLVLISGEKQEAVLYWFKTGDKLTGNYFLNALHWARNQLSLGTPSSSMIKLTAAIGPAGEDATFDILQDFAIKFVPILLDSVS